MYDLIIIGGGPAGVSAGIYATRQRIKTLLITKDFGGQIVGKPVPVENYPGFKEISGMELMKKFEEHVKKFDIEIKLGLVASITKDEDFFTVKNQESEFQAKSVIVASGASPRHLGIKGEGDFVGKGVSYCPLCDGLFFKDKIVVIVGGGNAGFESALYLDNLAKKIYILESGEMVAADEENQAKAKKSEKIEIITKAVLKEIKGDNFVKSLEYEDAKSKEVKSLDVDGVFVEIGHLPATSFVKDLVKFSDEQGRSNEIEINPRTCQTNTPGLFAAGDVSDVLHKQVIIACAEGAKAALSAFKYLQDLKN